MRCGREAGGSCVQREPLHCLGSPSRLHSSSPCFWECFVSLEVTGSAGWYVCWQQDGYVGGGDEKKRAPALTVGWACLGPGRVRVWGPQPLAREEQHGVCAV